MGISQVAHAELAVADLDEAIGFHTDVLGMRELGRADGAVRLSVGIDGGCDLVLTAGGTGVRRFALRVDDVADLDRYAKRLAEAGVATETRTDEHPGVVQALRFQAPSGHAMELAVLSTGPQYVHPAKAPHRGGIRALDFDHITVQAQDPKPLVDFLVELLDFQVSDIFAPAPGVIGAAWCRASTLHHDIAIISTPEAGKSLHHYALGMESFDHLKVAADELGRHGVPIEVGPGRHGVGGNVYTYFWAAGNRYELSAEMPRVRRNDPVVWDDFPKAFSPWGLQPPESFGHAS
ncbi:VOC family protein [Amycolatopsis sp. NPDC005961]|uniref:VOC family protein n=1 Tax=Amycolatopsis sp. NPDC005961 TaxID=3156720 RepID=UPI0033C1E663